jgi:coenzyme F420-dependent glucose-6-phosphate dehydrogenase
VRLGYKASAEQFGPRALIDYARLAEDLGFDIVLTSDHFQPWRHTGGHSPSALAWLGAVGEATARVTLGTSVLTPTLRYNPSVVAQAFATLGVLYPGRVLLGVGSGEAMNETPATDQDWPGVRERRERLAESIELIRRLWTEERVDFAGTYYRTRKATVYDRPDTPVPVYLAASGPLAARLAGRLGDGFICTSGKAPELYGTLSDAVDQGARDAGRNPSAVRRMIEVKVSYRRDRQQAFDDCAPWAALALTSDEKTGIEDPLEMERVADANIARAATRFIVSDDPHEVAQRISVYQTAGFDELVIHLPGYDQQRALNEFASDVLPELRRQSVSVGRSDGPQDGQS